MPRVSKFCVFHPFVSFSGVSTPQTPGHKTPTPAPQCSSHLWILRGGAAMRRAWGKGWPFSRSVPVFNGRMCKCKWRIGSNFVRLTKKLASKQTLKSDTIGERPLPAAHVKCAHLSTMRLDKQPNTLPQLSQHPPSGLLATHLLEPRLFVCGWICLHCGHYERQNTWPCVCVCVQEDDDHALPVKSSVNTKCAKSTKCIFPSQ